MPASTAIKLFHSAMTGAPVLNQTAGSMIAVLDACLVNGFGSATVDSLVVASNTATVTRAAGHPFEVGSVVLIAGATPSDLNGEQKVLSTTTTTYTFETSGISNQTATGTITHKLAPLGFEKAFSGTNLAAYRSQNIAGTRMYLRVDDTSTTLTRVVGYETMSDINTGTGAFPTSAQISGGGYWHKSQTAATASWVVIGDDRGFYLALETGTANSYTATTWFGDIISYKAPDTYGCTLVCSSGSSFNTEALSGYSVGYAQRGTFSNVYTARAYTGLGSSSIGSKLAPNMATTTDAYLYGTVGYIYPNPTDNAIVLLPVFIQDQTPFTLRGQFPGVYVPEHSMQSIFANLSYITGITSLPGKTLRLVQLRSNSSVMLFDTTGPWR